MAKRTKTTKASIAARKAELAARGRAKREAAERAQVAANLANDVDDDGPPIDDVARVAPVKILGPAKPPRLPDGVDFDEWLEAHALVGPPESGVFYVVMYAHEHANDPLSAIDACPAFVSPRNAQIAAHELSRGNMPHIVVRCEIVSRSEAHDD